MGASRTARGDREGKLHKQQFYERVDSKPKLWRKLQVHKSTALGLVVPFANLQLEVRNVDVADQDLGLVYATSKLHWVECFVTKLPKFKLYHARETSLPSKLEQQTRPIVKVTRPLWNYARSTLASMEIFKADDSLISEHSLPSDVRTWRLHQKGLGRYYELISSDSTNGSAGDDSNLTFLWKGSKQILSHLEDYNPNCHGNLKLVTREDSPIAAWKQQRDSKVLGSIHIFEEARDVLPVEVIVASCLCLVIMEKCTGVTWFGGMGGSTRT